MRLLPPPQWVGQVDLGRSLVPDPASRSRRSDDAWARILIRLHGEVIGLVDVPLIDGDVRPGTLLEAVRMQLAAPLACHLAIDGLSLAEAVQHDGPAFRTPCDRQAQGPQEPMSVVVCTRGPAEHLARCLEQLQHLRYGPFEVLVVDNNSSMAATRECFTRLVGDDIRFRHLHEPVAGLSRARNRGLAEARSRYVAFTDDDVVVDPAWLEHIASGFRRDRGVGCVTGLVPPAELDSAAQIYFGRRFSWSKHFEPRLYSLTERRGVSSLFPCSAGHFGTGANFAVDRAFFQGLGGFDVALGAGSPAGGGEDLDAFVRILRGGRSLAYEPSAVAWHYHRSDPGDLRRQLFRYGAGLTAFLTKHLCGRRTAWEVLVRMPEGVRQVSRMWSPSAIGLNAPVTFVLAEVSGMAAGPLAFARARRHRPRRPEPT